MRKSILLPIFVFISISLYSQQKGIVYYGQIESLRLKGPFGPDFNAFLAFDSNTSYYVVAMDSLDANTTFKKRYYTEDGMTARQFPENITSRYGKQVLFKRSQDSMYWNKWKEYYVAEVKPKIEWELVNETKQIGSFTAFKAKCNFRGRNYTAWYVLEIPLPYGPWKLQGLPGLIIEAYDEYKEFYVYFKSIEYPTSLQIDMSKIKRPDDHTKKWNTLEDYKKRLDHIYERMRNTSITIAEKMNTDVPEQQIKSEVFLESFD